LPGVQEKVREGVVPRRKGFDVGRVFKQGEKVTWKDGSGERQRGLVLQHTQAGVEADGSGRAEEVLVMREGTSHVSVLPPEALALEDG
jgi:hypothetical protein